ncbi:hypothetical protein FHS96_000316 [Sphingomonas zeicaulis]|uniref:hypothetical protein n=1 Tax=Sphingomonas zeicaulis TaxID=1632740 RepID=UPI003D2215D9
MALPFAIATLLSILAAGAAPERTEGQVAPGTIVIESSGAGADAETPSPFVDAVETALLDAQFLTLPGRGGSRYLARVAVTRTSRGQVTADQRDPARARAGNWGLSVTLPADKGKLRDLIATELDVTIVSRKDDQTVWRGRAVTVQTEGSPDDAADKLATKLAGALFRRFPQSAEEPIAVP